MTDKQWKICLQFMYYTLSTILFQTYGTLPEYDSRIKFLSQLAVYKENK